MPRRDPRFRLRIEFDGQHTLGPGKIKLLEAVDELGSISDAARSMGMSSRHAWAMLDDVNQCSAGRVFDTEARGRSGGAALGMGIGKADGVGELNLVPGVANQVE